MSLRFRDCRPAPVKFHATAILALRAMLSHYCDLSSGLEIPGVLHHYCDDVQTKVHTGHACMDGGIQLKCY